MKKVFNDKQYQFGYNDAMDVAFNSERELKAKVEELTAALQNLVDYYVKNPDTKSEFVTTVSGGSDPNAKHVVLFREAKTALLDDINHD